MATGALAIAGLAISAIGTGVSYMGMRQQQQAQASAMKANAKVQEQNAHQAELEAHERIRRTRRQNKKALARQRQAYADAGVLEEGTPLTVAADTSAMMELEAQDQLYSGQRQAGAFRTQAKYNRMGAASVKAAAPYQLAGTLLSGTSNIIQQQL